MPAQGATRCRMPRLSDLSARQLNLPTRMQVNDSAVKVLGDETLKMIARELVDTTRSS
jgi:hypothetical protein